MCSLNIALVYPPTWSHDDEELKSFHEDFEVATDRAGSHFFFFFSMSGEKVECEIFNGDRGKGFYKLDNEC